MKIMDRIVALAVFLLACTEVDAQIWAQGIDTGQTSSLGACTIHVDQYEGAHFQIVREYDTENDIENGTPSGDAGIYLYPPLEKPAVPEIGRIVMRLLCAVNSKSAWDNVTGRLEQPKYEKLLELTGKNWKGMMNVTKNLFYNNEDRENTGLIPNRNFRFCIKDNNIDSHILCGNGSISGSIQSNYGLDKIIDLIRTISFLHFPKDIPPGFDCTKTLSFAEKSICADVKLSLFDNVVSENYKRIISANLVPTARTQLVVDQRAWIKQRNACDHTACLFSIYIERIENICSSYHVMGGIQPLCVTVTDAIKSATVPSP
jgi:hypothetical protein